MAMQMDMGELNARLNETGFAYHDAGVKQKWLKHRKFPPSFPCEFEENFPRFTEKSRLQIAIEYEKHLQYKRRLTFNPEAFKAVQPLK